MANRILKYQVGLDNRDYLYLSQSEIAAGIDAGLRCGQRGLPLKWKDLDLTNGVVRVRESKTRAGIRYVPLTERLRKQLQRWQRTTGHEYSEFVFFYPPEPSKHLQKVSKSWARALKQAGIEFTRVYDLRATFPTRLNAVGVQPVIVSQLTGHAAQTYTKATDEVRRNAIWKLEAFVSAKIASENTPEVPKGWVN